MANSSSTSLTTSSSGRMASASPSTSVICQEVFDESCQPSADEINEYALLIGIDPAKEHHLLYLAREGLMQALPADWKICYSEEKCGHYYYNNKTKQSQWDHPLDAVYRELVQQARNKQTATPIIDNSDDASQLDSGIRSLQGNDEGDNTNNTNDMSPPISNLMVASNVPRNVVSNAQAANSTITSGFSGGVSRFLESRNKAFAPLFQPVRGTRFEVSKTNTQIGLNMKFGSPEATTLGTKLGTVRRNELADVTERKGGFTLSGTGAMFLKSRRQMETATSQASAMTANTNANSSLTLDSSIGTPTAMKGILRDSSLTDMRRRFEKEDQSETAGATLEDKKSVRFNLEEKKVRSSPEDEGSSSRRMTQSQEASINSDEDGDDDDAWDFDDDDDDEGMVGIGHLVSDAPQRNLNPFLMNDEKHVREIKVISVPKSQTIQMLKAQSFSMDMVDREHVKLADASRSQSIESASSLQPVSAVTYLDKLKDSSIVKPLYEDTDSDSKGSSVRSFIINKSESELQTSAPLSNNPFDLDELGRKHSRDVEQLEIKLQTAGADKTGLRSLKVASKLVGFLKKDVIDKVTQHQQQGSKFVTPSVETANDTSFAEAREKLEEERRALLKEEREHMEEQLQQEIDRIKVDHEQKLKNIRHEYDLRLASHRHELEETMDQQLEEYRLQLEDELDSKRKAVVDEHKAQMAVLEKNHAEILHDMERDLKSEEEIIKKEQSKKLSEMREKVSRELEQERQRMRETGEDQLYEKLRCEKRLLEDKYRCLKEKYIRLKTDVKLSLERRNRRREAQAMQQSVHTVTTTGSESISNKPSIGNSENRSFTLSLSCQDHGHSMDTVSTTTPGKTTKPPVPSKSHLSTVTKDPPRLRDKSVERAQAVAARKPGIVSKYIKNLQVTDDTTSMSQSDATISNNYAKDRYLTPQAKLSDNGNSDTEAYNQENNNNASGNAHRNKLFSRHKSASTSRLNTDNYKHDRPCTPVENLRHQLQKLEDLEDQFPENALDTTYHLRYPFTDISNDHPGGGGGSSELEFFKHRIHLERDSVRRAKESLRTQRTTFRARQREIKQRHKATVTRHTLDQLIQEEKELTDMEVNLHRTRALLGEKVIRLRHLEQSLLRIYEKDKPATDLLGIEPKEDATLSDLSSHSSSGFSSTDFASGADVQNINKRKDLYHQESSECIQNLEILNAEIREILDILGKSQSQSGMNVHMISPSELNWSNMISSTNIAGSTHNAHAPQAANPVTYMHAPQSIPTLADRLETYRQLASGRMQSSILAANTIVSQNPRALNYTTSLVERTRDLRNWLRQAKNEHDMLAGMTVPHGLNLGTGSLNLGNLSGNSAMNTSSGNSGTQTNL